MGDSRQALSARRWVFSPPSNPHLTKDYFGNAVVTFTLVRRHQEPILNSFAEVKTMPFAPLTAALGLSVSEAGHISRAKS